MARDSDMKKSARRVQGRLLPFRRRLYAEAVTAIGLHREPYACFGKLAERGGCCEAALAAGMASRLSR